MQRLFALTACLAAVLSSPPPAEGQCQPVQTGALSPSDGVAGDLFGYAVSFHGDRALVGALDHPIAGQDSGAAYLYERDMGGPNGWGERKKLVPADGQPFKAFGISVAIHGDLAIVGAGCDDELGGCAGAAYAYDRNRGGPDAWGQSDKLLASDGKGGDFFGNSAAMHGNVAFVGAPFWTGNLGNDTGAVYVFERSTQGEGWAEVQVLTASDALPNAAFGYDLAIDGDAAVIAARNDDGAAPNAGAAYVFRRDSGTGLWTEEQKLLPSTIYNGLYFGESADISGDTVVVGVLESVVGFDSGAVYVFQRGSGGAWSEKAKLVPSDAMASDWFGHGVGVDGDLIVGGAPGRNAGGKNDAGIAYAFERSPSAPGGWIETQKFTSASALAEDNFGREVAVDGRAALLGAPSAILANVGTGRAFVFDDLAPPPAAVYCTAGTSTGGCVPTIAAAGSARLSQPNGCVITAAGVEGSRNGFFYWGPGPQATPWGSGSSWMCVAPPRRRTPAQSSGGTSGACDGALVLDFNGWMIAHPSKAPGPGTTVHVQGWYRDPPETIKSSLTAGLALAVCP